MTDTIDAETTSGAMEPVHDRGLAGKLSTEDLADELMLRAQADGVGLVGPGGCWPI